MNTPPRPPHPAHFKRQLAGELTARAATLAALDPQSARGTTTGRRAPVLVRRPRLTLALGAAAAAVAVAVAVPLAGGTPGEQTPAGPPGGQKIDIVTADYVVKSVPDGMIAVKVMSAKGVAGLQATLRKAGVPAVVTTFSASCTAKVPYDVGFDSSEVFPEPGEDGGRGIDGRYSLIRPSAVPEGDHLLFVPTLTGDGGIGTLSMSVVTEVPGCVPESDNGIGAGYVAPGTNP
ncbi:hypothetical protein [Streptomyces laurentii]|uniref:hypothetical protein n=1 Tax=Streptomyces laurentii TaxID=39478 RepID=UPI0036AF4EEF